MSNSETVASLPPLIPVVLAGGGGRRLFPLSTKKKPKYLLKVNSSKTLIEETLQRASEVIKKNSNILGGRPANEIIIVINKAQSRNVQKFVQALRRDSKVVVLKEPSMKNTAPAIFFASEYILRKFKDAVALVMPSDHKIEDYEKFILATEIGYEFATQHNVIVTFGIKPHYPETNYGYIELGEELKKGVFRVSRFTEKPDLEKAKEFLSGGNYLWNSGIFMFRVSKIIQELEKYTEIPSIFRKNSLDKAYELVQDISIDYAVCEKSKDIVCVVADFKWSDVGSFKSLMEFYRADSNGNCGEAEFISSQNCFYVSSDNRRKKKNFVFLGMKNIVVAEGEKFIMIFHIDESQKIKNVAEILDK